MTFLKNFVIIFRNSDGNIDRFDHMAYSLYEAERYAYTWADRQYHPVTILRIVED